MRRTVQQWLSQGIVCSVLALSGSCISPGDPTPEKAPAASSAVPPEPARAALTIAADARYLLTAVGANKCVQIAGQGIADGAHAQIARCDGSLAQQYRVQAVPGGYHTIINAQSSKCLEIAGSSRDNGANVQQSPCNGGPNQQWIIGDAPGGNVRLIARHSGKAADVQGASTADGSNLIQWPWAGDPNQRFKLTAVATDSVDANAPVAKADKTAKTVATDKPEKLAKTDKAKKKK